MTLPDGMHLDGGGHLASVTVAYDTYGTLNADRSNAVLVCHPLTADQFAAREHPVTGKPGWWGNMIGSGLTIDTDKLFVICPNVLGGCMGSTGPLSPNPQTGAPYGLHFPVITIGDIVRSQAGLLDALGIDKLLAVIGGSMGGMQALQWTAAYPERVGAAAIIASAARHTPQNIAFHEVGRQAVMADPAWQGGAYHGTGQLPRKGLAVARMAAHVTYLSELALDQKFGRSLQDRAAPTFGFDADFQVESYLRHQGAAFVDRFDANAYLYITRATDYFDLGTDAELAQRFKGTQTRFLLTSFSSDWLYPKSESRRIVRALHGASAAVSYVEIESDKGHDAFLLDEPAFERVLRGFVHSTVAEAGL
ncbi:homoserine O-acetyltransferase MetX [Parvularcula sp. LCG005]|uniref:homoserine O-acetyltransferase MetX n=1 Tax=Parvularcula sp. LCG005 TaxID=3078805 RepID=UPI0029429E73|nr:homoserine O-acetyltransferase [Parvularcula sp. LCG005]WOI52870.1 homoserine O-acetyltransferase [Parvularcula sp. LCG005]